MTKFSLKLLGFMKFAFVLIFLSLLSLNCKENKESIKPRYRDITEAVYSTVVVEPDNLYEAFPSIGGLIENAYVQVGDTVQINSLLFKIRNPTSDIETENAQLRYEITKEAFNGNSNIFTELDRSINTLKMKMKNDSINYTKQSKLWDLNIGSEQEYESRKLSYEISKNEYDIMLIDYKRKKLELSKNTAVANNVFKSNKITKKEYTIRSKMDGIVYDIYKEIGESVSQQTPIGLIGSANDYIIKLLIDEIDIASISIGQKAIIKLDAMPLKVYEATITKIYPTKDLRSQTFMVEAEFITKPATLYNGLSGEANIIMSQRQRVLTVPSEYITVDNKLNTDNGYIAITRGTTSLTYSEIIGDIDTNTVIYKLQ